MPLIEKYGANSLRLEPSGKLDAEEMRSALDELNSKSKGIEQGKMLYRITNLDLPTIGAIGSELSRIPELFKIVNRFDRAAVLA